MDNISTFIIADTHFGHERVIEYCNRLYKNVLEMDEALIDNWNSTVSFNDIVYHLGDFALCDRKYAESIVSRLNGNKILIKGNHDRMSNTAFMKMGFIVHKRLELPRYKVILSHKPLNEIDIPEGYINYHGHTHNEITNLDKTKYKCFSVEQIEYKPYLLDQFYV